MTRLTCSRPCFALPRLEVVRLDEDARDFFPLIRHNFFAVVDRSRHSVWACEVEIHADDTAHVLVETKREFFPGDLVAVSCDEVAA